LFYETDKILVSDVDGTLTKDDFGGLYNNFYNKDYLHDGYDTLI
jgi:phosphatidate phosphatase PAH1